MKIYLAILWAIIVIAHGRRIRLRPVNSDNLDDSQSPVEYYTEQEDEQGPILVSRHDTYGRATGQARISPKQKIPEGPRSPPVQTIRNYNKLNDDGSFTFGYEAADGSFKEETRGTDCVVRGKYGYVDPDGNKREFTYVSGNPCDPNAVEQEEENESAINSSEENIPKNILNFRRPKPQHTATRLLKNRPATVLFQQDYSKEQTSSEEEENIPVRRPVAVSTPRLPVLRPIPTFAQLEEELRPTVLRPKQQSVSPASPRPLHTPTPRPKSVIVTSTQPVRQSYSPIAITPRPQTPQPPATTYRPQLVQATPTHKARPSSVTFDQEIKNFQLENNLVTTPRPTHAIKSYTPSNPQQPIYTSELVYDPNSGQYNTVVYQSLPQTNGEFNLRGRLQPFVQPQTYFQQPPRQAFIGQPQRPQPYQQQLFQQQQANLFQQSQQLYRAQQEKKQQPKTVTLPATLLQQEPQRFTPQPKEYSTPPAQPFYYVGIPNRKPGNLADGQIEAFLRGHSIAF